MITLNELRLGNHKFSRCGVSLTHLWLLSCCFRSFESLLSKSVFLINLNHSLLQLFSVLDALHSLLFSLEVFFSLHVILFFCGLIYNSFALWLSALSNIIVDVFLEVHHLHFEHCLVFVDRRWRVETRQNFPDVLHQLLVLEIDIFIPACQKQDPPQSFCLLLLVHRQKIIGWDSILKHFQFLLLNDSLGHLFDPLELLFAKCEQLPALFKLFSHRILLLGVLKKQAKVMAIWKLNSNQLGRKIVIVNKIYGELVFKDAFARRIG